MELRKVTIDAPVTVRACHLRFSGAGGAEQYRRRSHQLKPTAVESVYLLDGETMFKAGEVIETDFPFTKAMLARITLAGAKPGRSKKAA